MFLSFSFSSGARRVGAEQGGGRRGAGAEQAQSRRGAGALEITRNLWMPILLSSPKAKIPKHFHIDDTWDLTDAWSINKCSLKSPKVGRVLSQKFACTTFFDFDKMPKGLYLEPPNHFVEIANQIEAEAVDDKDASHDMLVDGLDDAMGGDARSEISPPRIAAIEDTKADEASQDSEAHEEEEHEGEEEEQVSTSEPEGQTDAVIDEKVEEPLTDDEKPVVDTPPVKRRAMPRDRANSKGVAKSAQKKVSTSTQEQDSQLSGQEMGQSAKSPLKALRTKLPSADLKAKLARMKGES